MAAIPCARALSAVAGFDPISRCWRQLQPLRSDLTTAVPASAFELAESSPQRRKTVLQLHQTTIEIRDGMLQLRPYFQASSAALTNDFLKSNEVSEADVEYAQHAIELAVAIQAKAAGAQPAAIDSGFVVRSRSNNLREEAAELVKLSRWWPQAKAIADLNRDFPLPERR